MVGGGLAVEICNSCTLETKAGGSRVQGQPELQNKSLTN